MRKAAEPGVVEKIASFLGDNDYTRAWHDAVMVPVVGTERALINDPAQLRALAAEAASHRLADEVKAPGGYLGTPLAKEFAGLTGFPEEVDLGSQEAFDLPEGYRAGVARDLADAASEMSADKARQILEWAQRNPAARRPLSKPGAFTEMALGNAAAAYGLPAAGVGLAAWGVHDLLMAQQQAQKDSQLPLSGSGQQAVV